MGEFVLRHYQVSHETIYRSLYVQARGVLRKELIRRTMRRPRRADLSHEC
jgi:IS30 family transposase